MKTISAITPTYSGKYIEATMESIFNQTLKPLDYCITVDGKQSTFDKIVAFLKQKGIELINTKEDIYEAEYLGIKLRVKNRATNLGIGANLNDCIFMTEGDIICWCSADDEWSPNKLELQFKEYEKLGCPEDTILYCDYNLKDKINSTIMGYVKSIDIDSVEGEKIFVMKSCFVNFSTSFIPRTVFRKVGLFDPLKRFGEDYEWLMRAIAVHDIYAKCVPFTLLDYGIDPKKQETHSNAEKIIENDNDSRKKVWALLKAKKMGELEKSKYFPELK